MSQESDSEQIPVSMLNALLYCERRFYLEYVEGVMAYNAPVVDGSLKHQKPLQSSPAMHKRKKEEKIKTRNIFLGSEILGIMAVADILEEANGEIIAVEQKRGKAPRDEQGNPFAWENDAVQVCAQGMLVEECLQKNLEKGIVYYMGSRERVEVPFTKELREKTLNAIKKAKELAETGKIPPPLNGSPRCPSCSLLPLCLPEETLYCKGQKNTPLSGTIALSDIDLGKVLYVQEQGAYIAVKGESLVVSHNKEEILHQPLVDLSEVVVFGNVQFSTQAMQALLQTNIPVSFLSVYGRFKGILQPEISKHGPLRIAQYKSALEPDFVMQMAREIVKSKIHNCRALLMRSLRAHPESEPENDQKNSEDRINEFKNDLPIMRLKDLEEKTFSAKTPDELRGMEGAAAHIYFQNFSRMIIVESKSGEFDFNARNRRPPKDPVNTLISFAYAMLARDLYSAILTVGLDPYIGFYHIPKHGRPALALDLMEEFRPVIADSVVLTLINKQMVTPDDFIRWENSCLLTENGRKAFFSAYEQRKLTEITHPVFGYKVNYRRAIETQVRFLAAVLRGDIPEYKGFIIR